jgi:hypothetical protein
MTLDASHVFCLSVGLTTELGTPAYIFIFDYIYCVTYVYTNIVFIN